MYVGTVSGTLPASVASCAHAASSNQKHATPHETALAELSHSLASGHAVSEDHSDCVNLFLSCAGMFMTHIYTHTHVINATPLSSSLEPKDPNIKAIIVLPDAEVVMRLKWTFCQEQGHCWEGTSSLLQG